MRNKIIIFFICALVGNLAIAQNTPFRIPFKRTHNSNTEYMVDGDVTSDFGRRDCGCSTDWHKGVDFVPKQAQGIPVEGIELLSIEGGTIRWIYESPGTDHYKFVAIEGSKNFGYAHIFSDLQSGSSTGNGSPISHFTIKKMMGANEMRLAIIYDPPNRSPIAYCDANYSGTDPKVWYNNAELSCIPMIQNQEPLAPLGGSGGFSPHLHLYSFKSLVPQPGSNPNTSGSSLIVNADNCTDPLELVQHTELTYLTKIESVEPLVSVNDPRNNINQLPVHFGNSDNTIKVIGEMASPGTKRNRSGQYYENGVMNISEVHLKIKSIDEINYSYIQGPNFESKIVLGASLNSTAYPSSVNQNGRIGGAGTTGIKAFAYAASPAPAKDEFYFADFVPRLNINQNGDALINGEAYYPDNIYNLLAELRTVKDNANGRYPDQRDILIDNFLPFIERVEIYSDGNLVYEGSWEWDNTFSEYNEYQNYGAAEPLKPIEIKVFTSEPLKNLNISIDGLNYSNSLAYAQTPDGIEWSFPIQSPSSIGEHIIEFSGRDFANNSLLKDPSILVHRTGVNNWSIPSISNLLGIDDFHFINIDNDGQAIEPGGVNFSEISFAGFHLDSSSNQMEIVLKGIEAAVGEDTIDVQIESDRLRKMFLQALAIPESKHFISLDWIDDGNGGHVGDARTQAPFEDTDLARYFFEADVEMKYDLFMGCLWGADGASNLMSVWSDIVHQSPHWTNGYLQNQGFDEYPSFYVEGEILPDTIITNQENGIMYIKEARMRIDRRLMNKFLDLSYYNFPNHIQQDLQNRLNIWGDTLFNRLNLAADKTEKLLNGSDPRYKDIREVYSVLAFAKWYRSLSDPNKPYSVLINSEDLTDIEADPPFDRAYWDGQAIQDLGDYTGVDLYGDSYTWGMEGGCSMGQVNETDLGPLDTLQQKIDSVVIEEKLTFVRDSVCYFYGGAIQANLPQLRPKVFRLGAPNRVIGDSVELSALVYNYGTDSAQNVKVRFYDKFFDNSGIQQRRLIGTHTIPSIQSLRYNTAQINWIPTEDSLHIIEIVVDPDGEIAENNEADNTTEDSVYIYHNIPDLRINYPQDGGSYSAYNLALVGEGYDQQEGSLDSLQLSWASHIDGSLGLGDSLQIDSLSIGQHVISLKAITDRGDSAIQSISINILPPAIPTANILAPADGQSLSENTPILFTGDAQDLNDGSLCGTASWESSIDGVLGQDCSISANLSQGQHEIWFTATNQNGVIASDTISLDIVDGYPSLQLSQPQINQFTESSLIQFIASANDLQDGNLSPNILWYSQIDGQIGSGANISTTLSAATHTIQVTVIDSDGLSADTSFQLFVSYDPPVPLISSPQDNDSYNYQDTVYLIGSAQDIQDGAIPSNALNWNSDVQGYLGTGDSTAINTLSPGDHQISLTASDSDGNDSIVLVQNISILAGQPQVSIFNPFDGDTLFSSLNILFAGEAYDTEDGFLTGTNLIWSSSQAGQIGTGDSLMLNNLSPGQHIIRLTAIDTDGFSAYEEISIFIEAARAPSISIIRPRNGSSFENGTQIEFRASANDFEQGPIIGQQIDWESNLDGALGRGSAISLNSLSPGTHNIEASVTDNQGLSSTANISITINQKAPEISIIQPIDRSIISSQDSFLFVAVVSDFEEGSLPQTSITWESSLDSLLGFGDSLVVDTLSPGTHIITLSAIDSDGVSSSKTIILHVQLPGSAILQSFANGESCSEIRTSGADSLLWLKLPAKAQVISSFLTVDASEKYIEDKLLASDGMANDKLGISVSIDGNRAIVGAWGDDNNLKIDNGSAYIFEFDGLTWNEFAKIIPSDGTDNDIFGYSVLIDGNRAFIGSPQHDGSGTMTGAVYYFEWNGSNWIESGKLLSSTRRGWFGSSLAISGDKLLIGSNSDNGVVQNTGAAFIFEWNGNAWVETAHIYANDGAQGDFFGQSVSFWGDRIVIGAIYDDDFGDFSGSAYIFEWDGSNWVQMAKLLPANGSAESQFGRSVSIYQDKALVGEPWNDSLGLNIGAAYLFEFDGQSWSETQTFFPSNLNPEAHFGFSVNIEENIGLIGARIARSPQSTNRGLVYSYDNIDSAGIGPFIISSSDGEFNDEFGFSIDRDRDKFIIGNLADDDNGIQSGSSYIYTENKVYNPSLDINDDNIIDWSYSGRFDSLQAPNDFSSSINDFLLNDTSGLDSILVPIRLKYDSLGLVSVCDLNIQYLLPADTLKPNLVANISPNPVFLDSSILVSALITDDERVDSVWVEFKGAIYPLNNQNDSFWVQLTADTLGTIPIKIVGMDNSDLRCDTSIILEVIQADLDLAVTANSFLSPSPVYSGDQITLNAFLQNQSNLLANDVQVQIWNTQNLLKDTLLDFSSRQQHLLNLTWIANYAQDSVIILIDSSNVFQEADKQNNLLILSAQILDSKPPSIDLIQYSPKPVFTGQNILLQLMANDNAGIDTVFANFQGQNKALTFNSASGFFENTFTAATPGLDLANCTVLDVNGISTIQTLPIEVLAPSIDLKIAPQDITIIGTANTPQIQTTVHNIGNQPANNFDVNVYIDGILFDSTNISLAPGSIIITSTGFLSCGNHTVEVKLDQIDALTESNEANNTAITSFSNCTPLPPQILDFEIGPNPVAVNENFLLSVSVMDTTGIDSVIVHLPTGDIILLYNPANQKYENVANLPTPALFVLVADVVDRTGQRSSIQRSLEVKLKKADLEISSMAPVSTPVFLGQSSQLNYGVANSGLDTAFNARIEVWQDTILLSDFTDDFFPKDTSIFSISWIPTSTQTNLFIRLDSANLIQESNEANNSRTLSVPALDNSPPDIQNLQISTPLFEGGSINLQASVFDNDSVTQVYALWNGTNYPMSLNSSSQSYDVNIPNLIAGNWDLEIWAFDRSQLSTRVIFPISVNEINPDLIIEASNIQFPFINGNTVNIEAEVLNQGGASVTNAWVRLSIDALAVDSVQISLAAGQSQIIPFSWTGYFGQYQVGIELDPRNLISENDENNNTATRLLQFSDVQAPPAPNPSSTPSVWVNTPNFLISWPAVSDISGIREYQYQLGAGNWISVSTDTFANLTHTIDGIHSIGVIAIDNFGNISSPGYTSIQYDGSAPNAPSLLEFDCGPEWTQHDSPFLSWNNPGDQGSGVVKYQIEMDNGVLIDNLTSTTYHPIISTGGIHTFKVRAVDLTNNIGSWSNQITVKIDLDQPQVASLNCPTHPDQSRWYNSDSVHLFWEHPEDTSYISGYYYMLNELVNYTASSSDIWMTDTSLSFSVFPIMSTNPVNLPDGSWYFHLAAKDASGRTDTIGLTYQLNIDRTAPVTFLDTLANTDCYTELRLSSQDFYSGVSATYYRVNQGPWINDTIIVLNSPGNQLIDFYSEDFATNEEAIRSISFNLIPGPSPFSLAQGADSILVCDSVNLEAPVGNYAYQWSNGASSAQTTITSSGYQWVIVGDPNSGCFSSDSVYVGITSSPSARLEFTVVDSLVSFNASLSANALFYKWFFGDGDSSDLRRPSHIYEVPGSYEVILIAINPYCGTDTVKKTISFWPTSLQEEFEDGMIKVFPNPGNENFILEIEGSRIKDLDISLGNILGQVLWEETLSIKNGYLSHKIDISEFPEGFYNLKLRSGDESLYLKLEIKRE